MSQKPEQRPIVLGIPDMKVIMDHLAEGKYRVVAPVIHSIEGQWNRQVEAEEAAEKAAKRAETKRQREERAKKKADAERRAESQRLLDEAAARVAAEKANKPAPPTHRPSVDQ